MFTNLRVNKTIQEVMLKVLPDKITKKITDKVPNKVLPITVQILSIIVVMGLVGGIKLLISPPEKKPVPAPPPLPPAPVAVPKYFQDYMEVITRADKIVSENPTAFKNLNEVSLTNIQGVFQMPIKRPVTYTQLRLPGDPRGYRNDVHQGTDIYGLPWREKVYPIAPGVIIRIDKNYVPLTKVTRDKMLELTRTKWHGTPGSLTVPSAEQPYGNVLDKLRGRQVWIYHGKNKNREPILTMYAHLSDVNDQLKVYDVVGVDHVIGFVGNSGTSGEVEHSKSKEVHLHFEIFVGDRYWTPKKDWEIGKMQDMARYQELQESIIKLIPSHY